MTQDQVKEQAAEQTQAGQDDGLARQNAEIAARLAEQKRFILYRTQAVGWQGAGYVLLAGYLGSAADGLQVSGTAWVEDATGQYQPGQVYPVVSPATVTGQK